MATPPADVVRAARSGAPARRSAQLATALLLAASACGPTDGGRGAAPSSRVAAASAEALRPAASAEALPPAASDKALPPAPSSASSAEAEPVLLFVGDVFLGFAVGARVRSEGPPTPGRAPYPFEVVGEELAAADLTVVNLEAAVTDRGDAPAVRTPLHAPPAVLDRLVAVGVDVVSVANNHSMDLGLGGFRRSLELLDAAGLDVVGAGSMIARSDQPVIRHVRGVRVGLVAYYDVTPEVIVADMAALAREVDFAVAFLHWGAEYEAVVLPVQRTLARALVAAGADLVVGAHTHVPQPHELIGERLVAYGLGNYAFPGMTGSETTREGRLLRVRLSRSGTYGWELGRTRLAADGTPGMVSEVVATGSARFR